MTYKSAFNLKVCPVLASGILGVAFLLNSNSSLANGLLDLKSSPLQQNLVELYSSEGCSSCPPAESWVGSLRQDSGLWKKFVPVEFHVNYWDDLGWKDPYASNEFTDRQKTYAALWQKKNAVLLGSGEVYTPGMIKNGNEWPGWRSGGASELKNYGPEVGVLEAKEKSPKTFLVKFSPVKKLAKGKFLLNAALLGRDLTSQVSRGENSGRNLKHDFLAISLKKTDLKSTGTSASAEVEFTDKDIRVKPQSYSVVFWVTDENQKPVQAIGGDLSH